MISLPRLTYMAIALSFLLFGAALVDSFHVSHTLSATASSSLATRLCRSSKPENSSKSFPSAPIAQSAIVLKNSQGDNGGEAQSTPPSIDAILGITASLVVLFSEYTLKATGCGLPAGPFGIVGAVEGLSYLGVVGICANAASKFFSEDEEGDTGARRIATTLGVSAALVGIAVLVFQIADYGYIPNAVPMEGGMCE